MSIYPLGGIWQVLNIEVIVKQSSYFLKEARSLIHFEVSVVKNLGPTIKTLLEFLPLRRIHFHGEYMIFFLHEA